MNDTKNILVKCSYALGALVCFILLYSCDILENDVAPEEVPVEVAGTKIYALPNNSAYIDLAAMVKTQGTVRFDISSQPRKGTLSEISRGFLQYSPNNSINKARDAFQFSIFSSDNRLLKQDSVVIIIDSDTTNLPCGIYPQNDYYYGHVTGSVVINVLKNDVLCGDTTNMRVEIYRANDSYPPYSGSAKVLSGNRIQYTPANSFQGYDKIMYKVTAANNDQMFGFGIVYIEPAMACTLKVSDDEFIFKRDTLPSDTLRLHVLRNDILCDNPQYTLSISKAPDAGTATAYNNWIDYRIPLPIPADFSDSLIYKVCVQQECKTARARIKIN